MAFGNVFNFNVRSFEQLEQWYKDVKPIKERGKGITGDIRPLGSRGQKHARVEKIDDDTYACVFYNTRCVIYSRDNKMSVNHGGYVTQSTSGFINACMPSGFGAWRIQDMLHIIERRSGNYDTTKFYIVGNTPLVISNYSSDNYTIENAVIPTKRKVNRELTKAKRAKFMPFLQFAQGIMEVLNINLDEMKSNTLWYERSKLINDYYDSPETFDEEKYLDLLNAMVHERYHAKSFAQIKAALYRAGTEYDRIPLPVGASQQR